MLFGITRCGVKGAPTPYLTADDEKKMLADQKKAEAAKAAGVSDKSHFSPQETPK